LNGLEKTIAVFIRTILAVLTIQNNLTNNDMIYVVHQLVKRGWMKSIAALLIASISLLAGGVTLLLVR
jgi:hypothetical protein